MRRVERARLLEDLERHRLALGSSSQQGELLRAFSLDCSGMDLAGQDLRGVTLVDCLFERTDLRDADLRGAKLSHSSFADATLRGADLSGGLFSRADFSRADLGSIRAERSVFTGSNFLAADLSRAGLRSARLGFAFLIEADLERADIHRALLSDARLYRTNLHDVQGADTARAQTLQLGSPCDSTLLTGTAVREWLRRASQVGMEIWATAELTPGGRGSDGLGRVPDPLEQHAEPALDVLA